MYPPRLTPVVLQAPGDGHGRTSPSKNPSGRDVNARTVPPHRAAIRVRPSGNTATPVAWPDPLPTIDWQLVDRSVSNWPSFQATGTLIDGVDKNPTMVPLSATPNARPFRLVPPGSPGSSIAAVPIHAVGLVNCGPPDMSTEWPAIRRWAPDKPGAMAFGKDTPTGKTDGSLVGVAEGVTHTAP